MAGLDPAIVMAADAAIRRRASGATRHDGRVKPGHDGKRGYETE
jgi:hypothetical protein